MDVSGQAVTATGKRKQRGGHRRRAIAAFLLHSTVLGAAAYAPAVFAQQQAAPVSAQAMHFSIPAQSLAGAIDAFSKATGWQVGYSSQLAKSITTRPVAGTMAPSQALQAMLAGTDIKVHMTGAASAALVDAASAGADGTATVAGATQLDTIDVHGQKETAWGPVQGFVARQSAGATKTDTPIIETPRSVSVISRKQLDQQGVTDIGQAVRYEAGARTDYDGADTSGQAPSLRGFPAEQYLDGLRVVQGAFGGVLYDPYLLERIGLVKGPVGALFGQSYPGGLVDLVSKRPTEDPLHEVLVQGGSYDRIQGGFDFSGPIDADKTWLYRLTGVGFSSGTQVDYTHLSRVAIAPAITYQPDGSTSLTVMANFQHDPNAGFWNKLPAVGTLLPNPDGPQIPDDFFTGDRNFNRMSYTAASLGYAFEHTFDDGLIFRQNARFQHSSVHFDSVQADDLVGSEIIRDKFQDLSRSNNFAIDNQAEANFDTGPLQHKLLFGIDYQHAFFAEKDTDAYAPPLDILAPDFEQPLPAYTPDDTYYNIRQTQDQFGGYAQDQISFQGWRAALGVREDWARTRTTDLIGDTRQSQNDTATSWNAGLLYLFDNGIAPYVSYSTSFLPTIGANIDGDAFKPTTGKQYEAGIKYQPTFMDALFTASVFDLTQQNVVTPDLDNPNNSVQTGEIRSRGVELQAKASVTDNIDLTASYTYLDAKVTKANDGTEGNRVWAWPQNAAKLWASYTFSDEALVGLTLGGGVRYTGNTTDQSNTLHVPAFTLFDAAVAYDFGMKNPSLKGLTLAVNATNLFDKHYIQDCVNGCYYGLRRNVMATLKYRW